ncbi:MAG: hypothetical protein ACE1ZZ_05635 [Dehalococcoidia bacterium]
MAKFPADGSSYIEVDDSGGTPQNLSPYVDEIELLGQKVVFLDVTGLSDTAQRVIAGIQLSQDFLLRGAFDDQTITGPDAVLTGIVGQIGTVSLGPAGNGAGQRKISGEFLCLSYQVISRVSHLVKFESRFKQDDNLSLGSWP